MNRFFILLLCFFLCSCFVFSQNNVEESRQLKILAAIDSQNNREKASTVIKLVQSDFISVQCRAIMILGQWRYVPAKDILIKQVRHEHSSIRARCVWALSQINTADAIAAFSPLYTDDAWEVRCAVVYAFRGQHQEKQCRILRNLLKDQIFAVRYNVVKAMGRWPCQKNFQVLSELVRDKKDKDKIIAAACNSLGKMGFAEIWPVLLQNAALEKGIIAKESDEALTKLAPLCYKQLIEILADRQQKLAVRYNAGQVLGRIRARKLIPILYKIAADNNDRGKIRYLCFIMLADLAGIKEQEFFIRHLTAENLWVQRGAVAAIAKLKCDKALNILWRLLKDDHPHYEDILATIAVLDRKKLEKLIIMQLKKTGEQRRTNAAIRLAGSLRMRKTIPLLRRLAPENPRARWALQFMKK